ncbi:hypothetical protein [Dokdonella sp.]|uniref:hypothetical protein n=1 Tax=Dokdonella sp. TaxID=2291710 RepID=UPI001B05C6D2|nr:hypothetical protein [Dokdonella sp.]MBO9665100.1 hypothetical protein [Dokdonella sp.]
MSTNLNYQINYGSIESAPAQMRQDPNAPLYASEDGSVASLSNNECIFQVRRSGDTHVMTFQVLQALDQSREFRTLDEHVARILTAVPGLQAQRESVVRVLNGLTSRGLFVSDEDFLQRIANAAPRTPAPLRAVFIRACDRPQQLTHLFASLADYERRFRANRHYVLLDDSGTREAANKHRDLLREFARSSGCKLTYIGTSERERLVSRLARAVPGAATILPHLLGSTRAEDRFGGGRAWNLALLLSAGARFVLFDDDHRLPLRRAEQARPGLDPNPSASAYTHFYRNIENALGAGEEVGTDPFELHLGAVGHSLGTLVGGSSTYAIDRASLRGLALSRLDHLDGEAPILATHHGSYGSSRTESGLWLYQLPAAERAEFTADRESYVRNVEAGSIWYGYQQARAVSAANFTPFALDNTFLLPCTNPVGRGEDALFSRVMRLCHPNALTLELPVAVGHVQETQRRRSTRTLTAHTPRFNYFVSDFLQRQLSDFYAEDPAQRLELLAAHLRDVGAASERGRLHQLREYLAYARADLIERLQQQYDGAQNAPIYWQADIRTIIEANGRALTSKAPPRLGDWNENVDEAACAALLREETQQLAAAYEAWPSLWKYARDQGERLLDAI